ncbi:hypothetical protein HPB47_006807, partial [Ixodes persulcatus]
LQDTMYTWFCLVLGRELINGKTFRKEQDVGKFKCNERKAGWSKEGGVRDEVRLL